MNDYEPIARWWYEMGHLKRAPRTGWFLAGVQNPESVAEHTFRVAVIGFSLAVLEGADPCRTATLCVFHDTGETRTQDIPSVGRAYLTAVNGVEVVADQVRGVPAELARAVRDFVHEWEAPDSKEAQLAHDADKLECLCQAREYMAQGVGDAEHWATSSAAAVRSVTARRLAEAVLAVAPNEWWRAFVDAHDWGESRRLRTIASD
jgi:5'-deoxynucleotidase YfbR-like HD superfamily hydrolase